MIENLKTTEKHCNNLIIGAGFEGLFLDTDNARPHSSAETQETLETGYVSENNMLNNDEFEEHEESSAPVQEAPKNFSTISRSFKYIDTMSFYVGIFRSNLVVSYEFLNKLYSIIKLKIWFV
eukprot:TRINITY_DN9271_c0_g1_i1.p1 TRINITY_DN9271_c0_g1~~TRINITY_DN9271_c0_g1_i1.p1  ORF type:complete len:122 (-),score=2.15 TRINITY_DN9271_c0_g1_i1:2-367(-)